jgi:hypothetical protein
VEGRLCVDVYIQENGRRIDRGRNVQVFAGTFGHESGEGHAHIDADTGFLDHGKINEIGVKGETFRGWTARKELQRIRRSRSP